MIQTIYDLHYAGQETVEGYVRAWKPLSGKIDEPRFKSILAQLEYQAGQAEVWRDAVSGWFLGASGVADAKGRVGHYPGRTEAEAMTLDGYTVAAVTPSEDASGGKAVSCEARFCQASFVFGDPNAAFNLKREPPAPYDMRVEYFDQNNGTAHYSAFVNNRMIDEWTADMRLPSARLDSTSSTRRLIPAVPLSPGDTIFIEVSPDGRETAALDYVEIVPHQ